MFSQRPLPKTHSTTKVEKSKLQEVGGVGEISEASTHGHHRRQWFQILSTWSLSRPQEDPCTATSIGKHRMHGLKRVRARPRCFGGVWSAVGLSKWIGFTNPGLGAWLSRHGGAREIAIMHLTFARCKNVALPQVALGNLWNCARICTCISCR